jgi:putative transcriptional regulator
MALTPSPNARPKVGSFLLAEPFMDDPWFGRHVVFLCDYEKDGETMGFVLNNYIDEPLSALLPELGDWANDQRVSIGGPVLSTQIFFVHKLGHLVDEACEIEEGLYLGGRFESVVEAMESGDVDSKDIRFFLGYSGWSTGQLLDEIREKSWYLHFLPSKNRAEQLFDTAADEIWQEMLSSKGPSFAQAAQSPRNPNLN